MVTEGKVAVVEKPKAVVTKPKAVVAKPKAVVAPPKAVVMKPKAIVIPSVHEGGGGASHPSFPVTQEIIAASPTTREVLVRDIETREQSWQPATTAQIAGVTEAVRKIEAGERIIYPKYVKEVPGVPIKKPPKVKIPLEKAPLKAEEREFTIDPKWKAGELTAKGLVEWYVDRKGVKHYTPASTMWDLGYKTSTQHLKGKPAPYVAVTTPDRGVIHITKSEATKLSGLKGEDLHHAWISIGIIPKDTPYIIPAMREKAIKALKRYELPDKKFDLYRAIGEKVTPAYLDAMFGKEAVTQARRDYTQWIAKFTTEQKKLGYSDKRIAEQVTEIHSGKHLAYSPEEGDWVPTYREAVEQREVMGLTPEQLREVHSAQYTIPHYETGKPVAATKAQQEAFKALPTAMQKLAWEQGMSAIDISGSKPETQFAKMQDWGLISKDAKFGGVDATGQIILEDGRPWTEKYLNAEMAKGVGIGVIPIAGTIYHWEHMPLWMKGASIALDVVTLIPLVGGIAIGIRGGKTIMASIGRVALAEVKAPITLVTHPVATARAMAVPVQLLLHPKRIPLAATELRSYILKVPVKGIGEAKDAMKARDIITSAAIRGERPVIQVGGKKVEMATVALQQKIAPAAVHTTYDLRPFLSGAKVQEGAESLGLFVAPTLSSRLTPASAFGKGLTPAPITGTLEWTGRHITKIGKYHPQDIVGLDLPAIRALNLADAANIPTDIAPALKAYIRKEKGTIVGSFSEWLKLRKAKAPSDIDLNFANPVKARKDMLTIAKRAGYEAKVKESALLIKSKTTGQWLEVANVKGARTAFYKQHFLDIVPAKKIDGIQVIPLGEQYLRQGFGALGAGTNKATFAKRTSHMLKAAPELQSLVKEAGFTQKMPGALIIRDEKILSQLQPSGKLWRGSAEIEKVIGAGTDLSPPSQIIQTIDEAGEILYLAVIGKPFSVAELTKLKVMGSIDVVRGMFKTPIKIDKAGVKMMDEVNDLSVTARTLEKEIGIALKAGRTTKVAELRRQLTAINTRARAIGRQIDLRVAGATSLRAIGISTGDYIDRLSYRRLADTEPARLARLLRDMPAEARNRISDELTPKQRVRVKAEMERLSRVPEPTRVPELARVARVPEPARVPRVDRVPRVPRVDRVPRIPEVPRVPRVDRVPRIPEVPRVPVPPPPPPPVPPPVPPVPPPLRGASDKEKRKAIEKSKGALAFNLGEVGAEPARKRVWHTLVYPWRPEDYLTVVGKAPRGATILVEGENSAYRTAQLLYGTSPSRRISMDIGFIDAFITARGRKINLKFTPDPKGLTISEIVVGRTETAPPPISERPASLGRRLPPITEKPSRLSGRGNMRITPKRPALRR